MNLIRISWANLRSRPMNTLLSLVLLAFGVGIISLLLTLEKQLNEQFNRNIKDIDVVIGAKGSPLQLILANVYHVDAPTGNIKVADAEKILKNRHLKLYIEEAIPLAYGDNYMNYRIVGTDSLYPAHYGCTLSEGKIFSEPFEANIGSRVAKETGMKIGSTFLSTHGLDQSAAEEEGHVHEIEFIVTGIFAESNSVIDNLILTPVESVWMVHDHAHEHEEGTGEGDAHDHSDEAHDHDHADHDHADTAHDHEHDTAHDHEHDTVHDHAHETDPAAEHTHTDVVEPGTDHSAETHDHEEEGHVHEDEEAASMEVTAYLLKERTGTDKDKKEHKASVLQSMLPNLIRDTNIQSAQPAIEINRLTQNFGIGLGMLKAVAILIMMLSFISVFISLYNSLKDRKYELALMRTMGGSGATLFRLILQEGLLLTFLGFVIGIVLSRVGLLVLSSFIKDNFHYSMGQMQIIPAEWLLLVITLSVGILASLLPAWRALKIDISKTLADG